MSAAAIIDILHRESGRFQREIYDRMFGTSPWIHLTPRGEFPAGMGEIIQNLTFERSAPTDAEPAWNAMTIVDGAEGGLCLPSAQKIDIASTIRTFQLYRRVLEGPDICVENIRSSFELAQQLNAVFSVITEYSRLEWEIKDRHEYFKHCLRKVVVKTGGLSESATMAASYPTATANATLSQGVLDTYKLKLIRDGAGQSAMGKKDGAPILTIICSGETSEALLKENSSIRDDLRYAKPDELLRSIGVERDYKGFFHVIDPYPRRFTESGGVYTEVAPFIQSTAATKGNKAEVNPAYEAATHEETVIFDRSVFRQLVPKTITNPAPNFKFDPVKYTGDWKLMNILDRQKNPDGTIVYHRGHLVAASEPIHPERGVAFVHKRCDPQLNLVTACS